MTTPSIGERTRNVAPESAATPSASSERRATVSSCRASSSRRVGIASAAWSRSIRRASRSRCSTRATSAAQDDSPSAEVRTARTWPFRTRAPTDGAERLASAATRPASGACTATIRPSGATSSPGAGTASATTRAVASTVPNSVDHCCSLRRMIPVSGSGGMVGSSASEPKT